MTAKIDCVDITTRSSILSSEKHPLLIDIYIHVESESESEKALFPYIT